MAEAPKTAVIVIIGDEILKGQVQDVNSHFIANRLYTLGIRVLRIEIVPDDVTTIATHISRGSRDADYVITTGGIGPTHDDVTYEGVARALGVDLKHNAEMEKAMRAVVGCKDAGKMAMVPECAKVVPKSAKDFPVIQAGKVFVLPGIPSYCQIGFEHVQLALRSVSVQFFTQQVIVKTDEMEILDAINTTVDRFTDRVTIGSYPFSTAENVWYTRLTLESTSVDDLCEAHQSLVNGLGSELIDPALAEEDLKRVFDIAAGETGFSKAVRSAIQTIEKALDKYDSEEIVLSFNGGKDCTVLLHLLWAVYQRQKCGKLQTLYVRCDDPFPEIAEFIDLCKKRYNLNLIAVNGPIKPALESLVSSKKNVKAVWMGTRRSDPYAEKLKPFQMCDSGWPKVMRVSPLLDWSYSDVWTFIRCLAVPYCSLYDRGYTSLGSRSNTQPNPALFDKESRTYRPAYKLDDGHLERAGRN